MDGVLFNFVYRIWSFVFVISNVIVIILVKFATS